VVVDEMAAANQALEHDSLGGLQTATGSRSGTAGRLQPENAVIRGYASRLYNAAAVGKDELERCSNWRLPNCTSGGAGSGRCGIEGLLSGSAPC